jgi:Amt family ammonium transporter
MTTTLSASAGAITATVISFLVEQKYDLTMALNGALAGLVGITANCAIVDPWCVPEKPISGQQDT